MQNKKDRLIEHCTKQTFTVYNSLTEPLFTYFGGERIIAIIQQMGIEANELVQHKMISHSLQDAQDKIAKKSNTSATRRLAGRMDAEEL